MASCSASTCSSRGAPSRREIQLTKGAVAADLAEAQRARAATAARASAVADERMESFSSFFFLEERANK